MTHIRFITCRLPVLLAYCVAALVLDIASSLVESAEAIASEWRAARQQEPSA